VPVLRQQCRPVELSTNSLSSAINNSKPPYCANQDSAFPSTDCPPPPAAAAAALTLPMLLLPHVLRPALLLLLSTPGPTLLLPMLPLPLPLNPTPRFPRTLLRPLQLLLQERL
jgi:hypothetical protein